MSKQWIVDRLKERGYLQRDLAAAWGIAEGGVSRWLNSDGASDLPLSRAVKLAELLRMPLNELAIRLGFATPPPPTTTAAELAAALPAGTWVFVEGPDNRMLVAIHALLSQAARRNLYESYGYARLDSYEEPHGTVLK